MLPEKKSSGLPGTAGAHAPPPRGLLFCSAGYVPFPPFTLFALLPAFPANGRWTGGAAKEETSLLRPRVCVNVRAWLA